MKTGEILLQWTWNEVAFTLGWEEDAPKVLMNRGTKEGSSTWVCGYTLMKDAPGSEQKAYDFLDAWLDDASGAYMVTEWGYGNLYNIHPNHSALFNQSLNNFTRTDFCEMRSTICYHLLNTLSPTNGSISF